MVNYERSPSTVVVSENVFCQGMVVLLNPVCNWLSEMLHVYKSEVYVLQFSRCNDIQNTGIDPAIENRRIV